MTSLTALAAAAIYVAAGRFLLSLRATTWRDAAFAVLNLVALFWFFFYGKQDFPRQAPLLTAAFAVYVAAVSVQWLAMRAWARETSWQAWLAFGLPIFFLVVVRYTPILAISRLISQRAYDVLSHRPEVNLGWLFVGASYVAFRTSYLVFEVRNKVVEPPTYWRYLGFAFFAPTVWVGPISPYQLHRRGLDGIDPTRTPFATSMMRVLVGAVKYRFFGPLLSQLAYAGLLLDGHPHWWVDLPIAIFAYYLFLYCNFSGFCDIAIGGAGLMGVPVAENFDNPFSARNVKEFWNRWHITLSHWMRDIVFSPLSKSLVRRFGPASANHVIALMVMVVFLLVGIWHGVGWHYAAFGAMHGVGVAANHYYTISLKKRLGRERFAAYNRNGLIRAAAVAVTFTYVAACLFLFANDGTDMQRIFSMLRAH